MSGTLIIISIAHDPSWVGRFELALQLLEDMKFDEELILNNDSDKLKKFVKQAEERSICVC